MNVIKRILVIFSLLLTFLGYCQDYSEYYKNKEKVENSAFYKLLMVKNYIIEGNLEKASYFLLKISDDDDKIKILKERYNALIMFLKDDFKGTLEILSRPIFKQRENFKKICILKVLSLLALNKKSELKSNQDQCTASTIEYSKNEHLWLTSTIPIKIGEDPLLRVERLLQTDFIFTNKEIIKIWLKRAIYNNKEKEILKRLGQIPSFALRSKKIRELIGLIYYRTGNSTEAMNYISDLKTTNAYNIKGIIELEKKNYDKAFDLFQKALSRKEDSLNALMISIPLSYITSNWEIGSKLLTQVLTKKNDEAKRLALDTVFNIRMNNYDLAMKKIKILENFYRGEIPFNIIIMASYSSLQTNDIKELKKFSYQACLKFDGINCWVYNQLLFWDDLPLAIKNKDLVTNVHKIDIEALKNPLPKDPLKENPIVDQKDIEELDSLDVIKNAAKLTY